MFHNTRPVIFVLVIIVGISLLTQQTIGLFATASASESSPYESGRDHGCDDAGKSDPGDRYINEPGKGPSFHTEEFMAGYNAGFNECAGGGGEDFDEPEPGFDPGEDSGERYYEGWNWEQICEDVDSYISEPCDDLVTSDGNALTAEGKRALERIACGGQAILGVLLTNNLLAALQGLRC
jgi:hypothetical protein